MKCVLAIVTASLLLLPQLQAQDSAADQYVVIYNLIQRADALNETGTAKEALAKYVEAQAALKNFQGSYPNWNVKIVSFRLNYIASKITPLAATISGLGGSPSVATKEVSPAVTPTPAVPNDAENQLKALQDQLRQAEADNAALAAKLKEATSTPPSTANPGLLANAEERIKSLEQENQLLKASLGAQQAKSIPSTDAGLLEQTKQALVEANRKLEQQTTASSALAQEKETLRRRVETLTTMVKGGAEVERTSQALAETNRKLEEQTKAAASAIAEKDALQKSLETLNAVNARATSDANQVRALQEQIRQAETDKATLEAKLKEALSARPAAMDPRELAKAEEKINTLQKENELLKTSFEERQTRSFQPLDPTASEQTKQALAEANRKLVQQTEAAAAWTREKQTLQNRLQTLAAQTEASAATRAENEVLKKQVDELKRSDAFAAAEKARQALAAANRKLQEKIELANALTGEKESLQRRLEAPSVVGQNAKELEQTKAALAAANRKLAQQTEAAVHLLAAANTKLEVQTKTGVLLLAEANRKLGEQVKANTTLRQENESLQRRLTTVPAPASAELVEARRALAEANRKLEEQVKASGALAKEREVLENRLALLSANSDMAATLRAENEILKNQLAVSKAQTPAASGNFNQRLASAESERDALRLEKVAFEQRLKQLSKPAASTPGVPPLTAAANTKRIKQLEQERDELQKKLAAASRELVTARAGSTATARGDQLANQLAALRAKLEVFEARPVPYTPEELALFKKPEVKLTPTVEAKAGKTSTKELPPGAVKLVAEAQRYFAGRQFDKAEEKYLQVLQQDDKNVYTLANLASIQLELNHLDEAEKHAKEALALDPNDAFSLGVLGNLKFRQKKYDEALDALSRAAQLNPQSAEIQNFLGITLSHKGMRGPAETALRKAIQLDPGYGSAHNNLAVIYISQEPPSVELARWHYQKALAAGHERNANLEKMLESVKTAEVRR